MTKKKNTKDAVKVLHNRYIKGNKNRIESLQRQRENLDIAEQIYNLRTQAGLSQKRLADLVGTTQSVISRLEDADYNGHSLAMLRKIASAFQQKVQVKFIPETADSVYT